MLIVNRHILPSFENRKKVWASHYFSGNWQKVEEVVEVKTFLRYLCPDSDRNLPLGSMISIICAKSFIKSACFVYFPPIEPSTFRILFIIFLWGVLRTEMFIPDPWFQFVLSVSQIQGQKDSGSRILLRIKEFKYLTQNIFFQLSEIWSWLFIPDPDLDFLPIQDPGSRDQKGTGSPIRIRNTGFSESLTSYRTRQL